MKFSSIFTLVVFQIFLTASMAAAQQAPPPAGSSGLASLLVEAEHNNPEVRAARQAWESAQQLPTQVSVLPDPVVMVQQLSVGSPRPFAGYTNSEMANFGLGVSQQIPYPGKRRLRGQIAAKGADVARQQYEAVRRNVLEQVKAAYFRLAYLARKQDILTRDQQLLRQVEQSAEAHYRSGMGSQQDVLQAQLESTRFLREITTTQLDSGTGQARLKQLLDRPQTSPDVAVGRIAETPIPYTYDQLLAAAQSGNPEIVAAQHMLEKQGLQVDLAHKDFYPDFTLQYMWLRPDPFRYRARYQVSLGVRIPIYRSRRQQPELAQAEAERERARSQLEARSQLVASELRQQYLAAEKSGELLKIYRQGLLPQARAELEAGFAAYQSNRADFQALLASFLDVLRLDEQYWQTISEHETALAQIEQSTGLSIRRAAP